MLTRGPGLTIDAKLPFELRRLWRRVEHWSALEDNGRGRQREIASVMPDAWEGKVVIVTQ